MNTFSKHCKDNTKNKFDINYTYIIIQGTYKNIVGEKMLHIVSNF